MYYEEDADQEDEDETKPMDVDTAKKLPNGQQLSQQQVNEAAQSPGSDQAPKVDKDAALVAMLATQTA